MGYELDQLMKQYGVSTPTLSYSGMQAPTKPGDLSSTANATDRANYDALIAKYNADVPIYESNQAKYKTYSDEYKNRLATTSLYDAPQYRRGATSSPGTGPIPSAPITMDAEFLKNIKGYDPALKQKLIEERERDMGLRARAPVDPNLPDYTDSFEGHLPYVRGPFNPGVEPTPIQRPVLNQPTYGEPTPYVPPYMPTMPPILGIEGPPGNDGAAPPSTPDFGTLNDIGNFLSNTGLNTVGDYLSQAAKEGEADARMATNTQTGAYNQDAQNQRAAEAQEAKDAAQSQALAIANAREARDEDNALADREAADAREAASQAAREASTSVDVGGGGGGADVSGGYGGGGYDGGGEGSGGYYAKGGLVNGYADGGGVEYSDEQLSDLAKINNAMAPQATMSLSDLASKYAKPGFNPTFSEGSIEPSQSQMKAIMDNVIANKIPNPVINFRPTAAGQSEVLPVSNPSMPVSNLSMLQSMLASSNSGASNYASELKDARQQAGLQTKAFNKMLQDAISGQENDAPSKAEMYFRLAAAFGAPTKTGHFAESLAEVNKSMADQSKETRLAGKAGKALKLQLGLEGAKAGMAAAKDDVTALRSLVGEEMKDRTAYQRELIKDYFASGKAQSSAGKQAIDEGLVQGTPAFQARVKTISDEEFKKLTAGVDAAVVAAQASLAAINRGDDATKLAREKFVAAQAKATADAAKLSPPELKLKTETEDLIAGSEQAISNLKRAYALNPNTFDTSLIDTAQRKIMEAAGSKDPKVIATRELENLLSKGAVEKLRSSFGGNPTEGERKILLSLEGLESKSIEERKKIMLNAYEALQTSQARHKARLKDITSGVYRTTTPAIIEE